MRQHALRVALFDGVHQIRMLAVRPFLPVGAFPLLPPSLPLDPIVIAVEGAPRFGVNPRRHDVNMRMVGVVVADEYRPRFLKPYRLQKLLPGLHHFFAVGRLADAP